MKIRVNSKLADMVDELFKNGTLVVEDGWTSRKIACALSPLRDEGWLVVGFDRRLGKSVLVVRGIKKKMRKNKPFGTSIFELKPKSLFGPLVKK